MKILLIDDDPKVVRDMLAMFGYEVVVANDGFAGIQLFSERPDDFALVILDVQMPRMDGWAVLKYMRASDTRPNIPIIMLTACDEETSLIAGLRRGADEYLTKPITPGKLFAHIEAVTRRAQWETEAARQLRDPELESLQASVDLLTSRERELLRYLVQGFPNQKIGEKLSISETTVKNHLAHIFKKLNVSNRTQAAFVAQKLRLFQA